MDHVLLGLLVLEASADKALGGMESVFRILNGLRIILSLEERENKLNHTQTTASCSCPSILKDAYLSFCHISDMAGAVLTEGNH